MDEIKECKMYSIPEICKILGYSRWTVYDLIESGRLKGIQSKNRGHWRVIGKFLLQFMEGTNDRKRMC